MPNRSWEQIDAAVTELDDALAILREDVARVEVVQHGKLERRLSKLESSVRAVLVDQQWLMDRVSKLEQAR